MLVHFFIKAEEKWQDISCIHRSLTFKNKYVLLHRKQYTTDCHWEWNLPQEEQLCGTL